MSIGVNTIITSNRGHPSNRVYTNGGDCKNPNHIIYFNYDKKDYYASICIKPRKNSDTSKD